MQRAEQFHEQMRAGGKRDGFRLGLAGGRLAYGRSRFGSAIQGRQKPNLRRTRGGKNEQATAQEQDASLIAEVHERIVTLTVRLWVPS